MRLSEIHFKKTVLFLAQKLLFDMKI